MSSTSIGRRSERRSPRTSVIRDRQRSMTAIFAVTTSRSTTAHPLQERPLRLAAQDLYVLVHADRATEKGVPANRVAIDEETASAQHLHAEDGRSPVEVHEIDLSPEQVRQLTLGVEELYRGRAPTEESRQVE